MLRIEYLRAMRLRSLSPLLLLVLLGSCTSARQQAKTASTLSTEPLTALPAAPLYVRVTLARWPEVADLFRGPLIAAQRGDRQLPLSFSVLLRLDSLLLAEPASLDATRPIFAALHIVQPGQSARALRMGLLEEKPAQVGVLSTVMLPSSAPGALLEQVTAWWKQQRKDGVPMLLRASALPDAVRLDFLEYGVSENAQRAEGEFEQLLASAKNTELRPTSALQRFLEGDSDLLLYARVDRLQDAFLALGVRRTVEAVSYVNPADKEIILMAGAMEAASGRLFAAPEKSLIEDVTVAFDVARGESARAHFVATLTQPGLELAALREKHPHARFTAAPRPWPFEFATDDAKALRSFPPGFVPEAEAISFAQNPLGVLAAVTDTSNVVEATLLRGRRLMLALGWAPPGGVEDPVPWDDVDQASTDRAPDLGTFLPKGGRLNARRGELTLEIENAASLLSVAAFQTWHQGTARINAGTDASLLFPERLRGLPADWSHLLNLGSLVATGALGKHTLEIRLEVGTPGAPLETMSDPVGSPQPGPTELQSCEAHVTAMVLDAGWAYVNLMWSSPREFEKRVQELANRPPSCVATHPSAKADYEWALSTLRALSPPPTPPEQASE